jgi:hypothetical protein
MTKQPKVNLGDRVKISAFEDKGGPIGLVIGITHYLDGSFGYAVITSDFQSTHRHNLVEYEVHKVDQNDAL